jgi:ankyrin repeat protein
MYLLIEKTKFDPIHFACKNNDKQILEFLLTESPENINMIDNK